MVLRSPVRRTRQGRYQINLGHAERRALRDLAPQFAALLSDPERPELRRLFPPAYSDPADSERQREYRRLMLEDLVALHREALELLSATAERRELSEEELLCWSKAINSVRLVLGTILGVTEEEGPSDPTSPESELYLWLSYLQEWAVGALAGET